MDNIEELLNKLKTQVDCDDSSLRREIIIDDLKRLLNPTLLEGTLLIISIASLATKNNKQFLLKLYIEESNLLSKHLTDTPWSGIGITTDDIVVLVRAIDKTIADLFTELSDLKLEDDIEPTINKVAVINNLVSRSILLLLS